MLAEEGFRNGLYAIARSNALEPEPFYRAAQEAVYSTGFVLGRGSERDFWAALRADFRLQPSDTELTSTILERFVVRPRMLAAVRRLRAQGLTCAILSDQTDWLERMDARDHFYREFDAIFNSYRLGKGKRDAGVFDDVVNELGIEPGQAIFLDDSVDNVDRARSRGLMGICCSHTHDCLAELAERLGINDLAEVAEEK